MNGQPLLSQAIYTPFGPTRGWQWADGIFTVKEYDLDGRPTIIDSAGLSTRTYNPDGTIASISNDADASGQGTGTTDFTISSTSNRLALAAGQVNRAYTYDAAGNTLSDGVNTFTYNSMGRMATATAGSITTTYAYNSQGQRVLKSRPNATTYFVYDDAGHLVGEYDGSGALIQEVVWIDETIVGSIRVNEGGSGVGLYYVHSDHRGAPTKLTRSSDNEIVWRWDHDPFGNGAPSEDPDANGMFATFNVRFPGQYFDAETGLSYNYHRYFDQQDGRYLTPDPIGLAGGINTYAYGLSNPLTYVDPFGLDVTALYERGTRTLTATDNQTHESVTARRVSSGLPPYTNSSNNVY
ncbi:MAG TPA: RHS repeat-associated core domain-containing protein [Steroidobacteraceae bacterium]|nr:RHS repeat-associated core domain-containing protein [Steroidobacteraceae bacterium]